MVGAFEHVRVRHTMESHGHDHVDGFGNIHMTQFLKDTFWRLAEMLQIGASAHKSRDVFFGAFVDNKTVRYALRLNFV